MNPKNNFKECLSIFNALGNEVRQRILFAIDEEKDLSVAHVAERTGLSRPAVSHHLGILQSAGIISHRKVGQRERIYYFSFEDAMSKMVKLISSVENAK